MHICRQKLNLQYILFIMKRLFLLLLIVSVMFTANAQYGKFAGSMKGFIGKTFTDANKINGLSGWKFQEGSMLSKFDDQQVITAGVYKKGSTYIVLFSGKDDTASVQYSILDVLEVKNVASNQHIKTGLCSQGGNETVEIVALTKKETNTESSKAIKAWFFNMHKLHLESQSIKGVTCLNEVD